MTRSALYVGSLSHNRGGSVQNNFRYTIYTAVLDLDDLEDDARRCRLLSLEHANLFSLHGADYALTRGVTAPSTRAVDNRPLATRARELFATSSDTPKPDRIELVTQLRVLGYQFNPVSFFLGYRDDELVGVIAEINNTYDQTFAYVLDSRNEVERDDRFTSYETDKQFFVSPFIGDQCRYRWMFPRRRRATDAHIDIRMRLSRGRANRPFFAARLEGARKALSDRALLGAFLRLPALPAQIIGRIHLQALRLRWLGLQYRRPLSETNR